MKRGESIKDKFYITHFHEFIFKLALKECIYIGNETSKIEDTTERLIELLYECNLRKYKTILIDEAQDFKYSWFEFLKDKILQEGGSYTIFGDESQNIYDREQENKRIKVGIIGRPNILDKSYRSTPYIVNFAFEFATYFLADKYEIYLQTTKHDDILNNLGTQVYIKDSYNNEEIYKTIQYLMSKYCISQNDIVILTDKIENLRELDYFLRNEKGIQTITTFETKEMFDELNKIKLDIQEYINRLVFDNQSSNKKPNYNIGKEIQSLEDQKYSIDKQINEIRHSKKWGFWQNSSKLKLSTMHSYKGWECRCIILLVDKKFHKELTYTAITRAKEILCIFNKNQECAKFLSKFEKDSDSQILKI